jgi:hypothetical protein
MLSGGSEIAGSWSRYLDTGVSTPKPVPPGSTTLAGLTEFGQTGHQLIDQLIQQLIN